MADANFKTFFIDGAGAGPDGTGSACAWVRTDRDEKRVFRQDGLTCNQAEYLGLLRVLRYVAAGSRVRIFTDSQLVAHQYAGKYRVLDPELKRLLGLAKKLIAGKQLQVDLRWVPREENLAGKLLEGR